MKTTQPINYTMPPGKSLGDMQAREAERAAHVAELKSELAALRQVVADVETCRGVGMENGVTIFGDAEITLVTLTWPALHDDRGFEAPTWQAALHAAAEHVRREAGPSESSSVT